MKKLLLLLALICSTLLVHAQSKSDYEAIFYEFQKRYNKQDFKGVRAMFQQEVMIWDDKYAIPRYEEFGKILSAQFVGMDEGVAIMKVNFEKKGTKATGITIDDVGMLGTFRFNTSSPSIDKLIQ